MFAQSAACVLTLALLALPAVAQVHRWVDEQGRVHYGDRPLGAQGTTLRIRAESATAPTDRAATPARAPVAGTGAPAGGAQGSMKPASAARPSSTVDRMITQQRLAAAPTAGAPTAQTPGMAALIAQCKANRGVDCDTPQGMRNLQRENTPITREEQARIAGLRARRATCARVPGSQGC